MTLPKAKNLPVLGMLAALAGLFALEVVAYLHAGVFEYPLDDVYIHLAMASNITNGTYGVNAGEPASAASSILYPLLLTPFPNTGFQRLLPLIWNILAVAGCGWVWGRIADEAGLRGMVAWAVVLVAPVMLNISGVGFVGMETAPHMLVSLMIVLGLWRALSGRGVAPWLIAAAIAAPLFRYEGLALSLLSAAALFLTGHRRAAGVIAAVSVGAVLAFSLFLLSLGLDPVPGSVAAKSAELGSPGDLPERLLVGTLYNMGKPAGVILAALIAATAILTVAIPRLRQGAALWLLATVGLAALAHLSLGQIGWMHRYEPYIIVSLLGAILLASTGLAGRAALVVEGTVMVAVLATGVAYMPKLWGTYVWNPRAIHLQQAQMARFAQEFLKAPVAVNDLGRVAWGNPNYVLDLWGLGSAEAREIRFGGTPPEDGWAGPLAERQGVRVAMIYDKWFRTAAGPGWVRVGDMTQDPRNGAIGDWTVSFYATDPAFAAELRAQIESFAATLPEGATLTLVGAGA